MEFLWNTYGTTREQHGNNTGTTREQHGNNTGATPEQLARGDLSLTFGRELGSLAPYESQE